MGVRVNVICPGDVETDMNRASHPDVVDTSDWLQPEEVAEVAAFPVSPAGRLFTGLQLMSSDLLRNREVSFSLWVGKSRSSD